MNNNSTWEFWHYQNVIELKWEFPDVKYSSSQSALSSSIASINMVNHWIALTNANHGTPPITQTVKKRSSDVMCIKHEHIYLHKNVLKCKKKETWQHFLCCLFHSGIYDTLKSQ